jgi:hypothetical protein
MAGARPASDAHCSGRSAPAVGRLARIAACVAGDTAARLPAGGREWDTVSAEMDEISAEDLPWHSPKMFKVAVSSLELARCVAVDRNLMLSRPSRREVRTLGERM